MADDFYSFKDQNALWSNMLNQGQNELFDNTNLSDPFLVPGDEEVCKEYPPIDHWELSPIDQMLVGYTIATTDSDENGTSVKCTPSIPSPILQLKVKEKSSVSHKMPMMKIIERDITEPYRHTADDQSFKYPQMFAIGTKRLIKGTDETGMFGERTPCSMNPMINIKSTGKNDRHVTAYTNLQIGYTGGYFVIPDMGMELIVPPGAVDEPVKLEISILRSFKNSFTEKHYEWSVLAPRVRIEPNDIKYKKHIYFIMNHSLCLDKTQSMDPKSRPMLLHRNHEDDKWTEITNVDATQDESSLGMFTVCEDKTAILTRDSVIIQMSSNCELCFTDRQGKERRAQFLGLEAYADYHHDGRLLEVRVHALNNIRHRYSEVQDVEMNSFGGHKIGHDKVLICEENPLEIRVNVTYDGKHGEMQVMNNNIQYNDIRLELDHSPGWPPYRTFGFQTNVADDAGARPNNVHIHVEVSQFEDNKGKISSWKNIDQLIQRERRCVSSCLQSESVYVPLDHLYAETKDILKVCLTDDDVNKLRRVLDHLPNLGSLPYPAVREIIANTVVKHRRPQEVLDFLHQSRVKNDEIRVRLEGL